MSKNSNKMCAASRFMVQIIGMDLLAVCGTWWKKVDSDHCGEEMAWVFWKLLLSLLWSLPVMSRFVMC